MIKFENKRKIRKTIREQKISQLKNKSPARCNPRSMPCINILPQAPNPPPGQREPRAARNNGPPEGAHQRPPTPRDTETMRQSPKNQILRANINIATLNMNGFTAPANHMTGIEKWSAVYHTINENKIAILALQETHLDQSLLHDINTCFGKRITVINSQDPNSPRATAGVAFVINKSLIAPKEISTHELIKGRALALKVKWRENEEAVLINVYAPNNRNEHREFWNQMEAKRRSQNLRRPDFLMGDFNVMEDPIDRAPARPDDPNAVEALRNLRHSLDLQDSWRHAFPNDRSFTYRANNNGNQIKSRLDRIYTSSAVVKHTFDWKTCLMAVPTDHWLVSTKYAPAEAPYIGKGRWTLQLTALENKERPGKKRDGTARRPSQTTKRKHRPGDSKPPDAVENLQARRQRHGQETMQRIKDKDIQTDRTHQKGPTPPNEPPRHRHRRGNTGKRSLPCKRTWTPRKNKGMRPQRR
jgi:exonuclease III